MATTPLTLTTTWQQYEKLVAEFNAGKKPKEKILNSLNYLANRSNNACIGNAIAKLFFVEYDNYSKIQVEFLIYKNDIEDYPIWPTEYDEERKVILINPVGVFQFLEDCEAASSMQQRTEVKRTFLRYRYYAFLTELKRLPPKIIMFLLILQQMAIIRCIADVETKQGVQKAEGMDYLSLIWAFKELERYFNYNSGIDLRSQYKISWYEADWSVGV